MSKRAMPLDRLHRPNQSGSVKYGTFRMGIHEAIPLRQLIKWNDRETGILHGIHAAELGALTTVSDDAVDCPSLRSMNFLVHISTLMSPQSFVE